jgi:hypothetical protein
MALLEKAKKASEEKDDKKKKHKHPAAKEEAVPSAPSQPDDESGADESEGSDQDQPNTGADDAGAESAPESGADSPNPPAQGQQEDGDSDQGGAEDGGDQQGGQQNAQGAAPVPSPAAPGAGDTTSGGDDTPDQGQDQDPNAQPPQTPGEDTAAGPGSNTDLQQVPMSPGLKDEYDHANTMLMQLLYKSGDDKLATSILQGLMPQGPGKIKNAAMLSIAVLTQIHKKMNLPPQIIMPFAKDVVSHVMDLGQQVKQIQYSDQESTAILGSVYEAAMKIFGVSKDHMKNVAHHVGRGVLQAHQQMYQQAHAHAKSAIDQNNQDWHHPHLAPQAGGTPGPQTGAPVGAQPQPQQPAPPGGGPEGSQPAQGPPPAGGMLSAAAAQPEGEQNG